jgi:hypothetical protein
MERPDWDPWPGNLNYLISPLGNVWSLPREGTRGGLLKQRRDKDGYRIVMINRVPVRVHVLVLEAYDGPRPAGLVARHINGDKDDLEWPRNLEWNTQAVNVQDEVGHGTHKESRKQRCPAGHAYSRRDSRGKRVCYPCKNEARRAA